MPKEDLAQWVYLFISMVWLCLVQFFFTVLSISVADSCVGECWLSLKHLHTVNTCTSNYLMSACKVFVIVLSIYFTYSLYFFFQLHFLLTTVVCYYCLNILYICPTELGSKFHATEGPLIANAGPHEYHQSHFYINTVSCPLSVVIVAIATAKASWVKVA